MAVSLLETLPAELLLKISAYLAPYEAIALGLTCRRLYIQVPDDRLWADLRATTRRGSCTKPDYYVAPNEEQRWLLLQLFGKDLTSHQLCHFCRILHRLPNPAPGIFSNSPDFLYSNPPKGVCRWEESTGPRWWNLRKLTFRDVYLVMEQVRLGKQHGRPLSSLSISTEWKRHPSSEKEGPHDWNIRAGHIKLDMEAAVLGGNLALHTTQRLWIPVKKQQDVKYWMSHAAMGNSHGFQVCRHDSSYMPHHRFDVRVFISLRDQLSWHWQVIWYRRAPQWRKVLRYFTGGDRWWSSARGFNNETRQKCPFCPTSTMLKTYDHGREGVEVVLDVWQNLGKCESPDDAAWSSCWQVHCMTGTRKYAHACSISSGREEVVREARQKFLDWLDRGNKIPEHGAWCNLPAGESGIRHPSARKVMENWQSLRQELRHNGHSRP